MAKVLPHQELLDEVTDNWPDTPDGWSTVLDKYEFAAAILSVIPDGWAKVDGEWMDLNSKQGRAFLRCAAAEGQF